MIDPKNINEIIQNIMASLPSGLKNMPKDVEQNFRSALQGMFSNLDLVTREEFDAQTQVLLKTRQKVEALEKQVNELESESKK